MLTEICAELKNYFVKKEDIIKGDFLIQNGIITPSVNLAEGQFFRIVGSIFNDGVHSYTDVLVDEPKFHGAVWLMRVPQDVIELSDEIAAWLAKYGGVNSQAMTPYTSESFGGYSYTKSNGTSDESSVASWQNVFASRLNRYRRIRVI